MSDELENFNVELNYKLKKTLRKTIFTDLRKQMYNFFTDGKSDLYIAKEMHLPRSTI